MTDTSQDDRLVPVCSVGLSDAVKVDEGELGCTFVLGKDAGERYGSLAVKHILRDLCVREARISARTHLHIGLAHPEMPVVLSSSPTVVPAASTLSKLPARRYSFHFCSEHAHVVTP